VNDTRSGAIKKERETARNGINNGAGPTGQRGEGERDACKQMPGGRRAKKTSKSQARPRRRGKEAKKRRMGQGRWIIYLTTCKMDTEKDKPRKEGKREERGLVGQDYQQEAKGSKC